MKKAIGVNSVGKSGIPNVKQHLTILTPIKFQFNQHVFLEGNSPWATKGLACAS